MRPALSMTPHCSASARWTRFAIPAGVRAIRSQTARLTKILDHESWLLEIAAQSSKLTPHGRTALRRLTLLQIANRLERYAAMFEASNKKPGAEPG